MQSAAQWDENYILRTCLFSGLTVCENVLKLFALLHCQEIENNHLSWFHMTGIISIYLDILNGIFLI